MEQISVIHPCLSALHSTRTTETAQDNGVESTGIPTRSLTSAMAKGDEEAFFQFHRHYSNRLFRYLLVLTRGDEDQAREVLQATLIRVARYVKKFDTEKTLWNWLATLMRTAFVDSLRRRRRNQRYISSGTSFESHADVPLESHDELWLHTLEECLDELDSNDQALVEAAYFEHKSHSEIAAAMGTTAKAVESRLARIRKALRRRILANLKNP